MSCLGNSGNSSTHTFRTPEPTGPDSCGRGRGHPPPPTKVTEEQTFPIIPSSGPIPKNKNYKRSNLQDMTNILPTIWSSFCPDGTKELVDTPRGRVHDPSVHFASVKGEWESPFGTVRKEESSMKTVRAQGFRFPDT